MVYSGHARRLPSKEHIKAGPQTTASYFSSSKATNNTRTRTLTLPISTVQASATKMRFLFVLIVACSLLGTALSMPQFRDVRNEVASNFFIRPFFSRNQRLRPARRQPYVMDDFLGGR
ncbi:hypothetical protein C7M84_023794 [Penaeus vannamei]|uniref:Uncharacterized protein n=1 Tax=Penaeus vannamei TaxID=6689 RepID=A0A423U2T2_PENVA|nr:uncharacterized protein LOC113800081 [Penaeus vannamei]ROT83037.1 hypothetical protein C7M84_023794 [Penaeus vannamei]